MIGRMSFLYVSRLKRSRSLQESESHGHLLRHHRLDAERHQESSGLLHREPACYMFGGHGRGRILLQASFTSPPTPFSRPCSSWARVRDPRLSGEQDMRKMGGLSSKMPITYKTMLAPGWPLQDLSLCRLRVQRRNSMESFFELPSRGDLNMVVYVVGLAAADSPRSI